MNKVFLSIGHGGKDPGTVAYGLVEKDINLVVGLECANVLKRHGILVMVSRDKDIDNTTADSIKQCNEFNPTLAIDIHNNAGGGDGFECFHQHKNNHSYRLALALERSVLDLGQNSRGVKTRINPSGNDHYGFLRETKCISVLVEGAFLDTYDRFMIDTVEEQKAFGLAYAKAILEYLGMKYQPPTYGKLYRVQVGAFSNKDNAVRLSDRLKKDGYSTYIVHN